MKYQRCISIFFSIMFVVIYMYISSSLTVANVFYVFRCTLIILISIFIVHKLQNNKAYYLPSFYLLIFFYLVPLFGIPGYIFSWKKIYSDFMGVDLDMKHAIDYWLQGTLFVMLGIYSTHKMYNFKINKRKIRKKRKEFISWDWSKINLFIYILTGISLIFTIISLIKIGYIPILRGNVALERFSYEEIVGDWIFKLSRLWLLVYLFSFIKVLNNIKSHNRFYIKKNIYLIILLITSFFLEGLYCDRFIQFVMIVFSVILINKSVKRIKLSHIIMVFLIYLVLAHSILFIRNSNYRSLNNIRDKVMLNTFSEYLSFAYIIKEYPESDLLHGKGFIGSIAPLFPKQVWEALNLNKDNLMSFNSAHTMAKILGTPWGMRIGIIGEGFINFGYWGILIIPFISGILFGLLENLFVISNPFDVKTVILSLAISILMWLPLAQSNTFLSIFMLNLYVIIIANIFFRKKHYMKNIYEQITMGRKIG